MEALGRQPNRTKKRDVHSTSRKQKRQRRYQKVGVHATMDGCHQSNFYFVKQPSVGMLGLLACNCRRTPKVNLIYFSEGKIKTMIVILFRSRLTSAAGEDYARMNDELADYVKTMPGFLAVKSFKAEDGERLTIVWWRDRESLQQWRRDMRHMEAKKLGRSKWYEYYKIEIAEIYRQSEFERQSSEALAAPE